MFTLGVFAYALAVVGVAFGVAGFLGVEGFGYSVVFCVIPGWLTVFVGGLLRNRDLSAYVVLVGTALRMAFVFLGFLVVGGLRPDLGFREFTVWLVVSYLVALALETWVVLLPVSNRGVTAE